jgi:GH25 family lysozyme M1 (1,4-beta-N-acetylmuramidase)
MPELVDVSHYQTVSSWPAVAAAGIVGVIAKATEGNFFHDPAFAGHVAGARAAGLHVGAYHFARPDLTAGDATTEADYFCDAIAPHAAELDIIPMLDLEAEVGLAADQLDDWVLQWCQRVEARTGRHLGIYCATWFSGPHLSPNPALAFYPLWVASWTTAAAPKSLPAPWGTWALWQYGGSAVPGISGTVDRDRCYDLTPLLTGTAPVPVPPPPSSGTVEVNMAAVPIVKKGSTGQAVKNCQALLNAHGAHLTVDGIAGSLTDAAIRSFQGAHGLTMDGIAGVNTWSALVS